MIRLEHKKNTFLPLDFILWTALLGMQGDVNSVLLEQLIVTFLNLWLGCNWSCVLTWASDVSLCICEFKYAYGYKEN